MYDTILIPTDGSDHAIRAAEHGRYLAEAFDATVHVISVADVQAAAGVFDAGGVDEAFVSRLEEGGATAIEATVGEASGDLRTAVLRGEPSEEILAYAADHAVDVIAMGTHGRRGLNRYIAGSVTERILRLSDVPVLTVRVIGGEAVDYDDVLVPTDGSVAAAAAVDHGLAIADAVGARVHALTLTEPGAASDYLADQREAVGEIATRACDAGIDVVEEVREGRADRGLLAYAEEQDVDLIAMATTGRRGLNRVLLGSTTESVLRRAEAPVLAVNARAAAERRQSGTAVEE